MIVRWVLVSLGCSFLLADLLHLIPVGVALPVTLLLAIASVVCAVRDGVGPFETTELRDRAMRLALGILACSAVAGGVASRAAILRSARHGCFVETAYISDFFAPPLWLLLLVFIARALSQPTQRRLGHVAVIATITWPLLHVIGIQAQHAVRGDLHELWVPALQIHKIGVLTVAALGAAVGIVGTRAIPTATPELVAAIALRTH